MFGRGRKIAPYLFISPFFIGYTIFFLYPVIQSLQLSFYRQVGLTNPPRYIGFDNYVRLVTKDALFIKALTNTTYYALGSILIIVPLALLLAPAVMAQDGEIPFVLALTEAQASESVGNGILDALQAQELISEDERAALFAEQELDGERIRVVLRGIGPSMADISLLIESALDQGVSAIIAHTSAAALAALNLTIDRDEPPAVIFTGVVNPYGSGLAQASCIKPDHVTGMMTEVPYADILALLLLQDPHMQTIGTLHSSNDIDGVYGAEVIAMEATELGLTVESAAIAGNLADLPAAANGLVSRGIEAIVMPLDLTTGAGVPIVSQIAIEYQLPLFYATPASVLVGATVGGGAMLYYEEGLHAGYVAAAHLKGDIDIARMGVHSASNMFVGVNLDLAQLQGIEIAAELMQRATIVVVDGELQVSGDAQTQFARGMGMMAHDAMHEDQMMMLAHMQCSDEMIAEQQAALDAAGG